MKNVDPVQDAFAAFLKMGLFVMMMVSFVVFWLMFSAPRDPMGILCEKASYGRSLGAFLRGQHEVGCLTREGPIQERHGWAQ